MFMPNQSKGFSLIEISLVLAIMSLLAAFAYPCYTQYLTKTRRLAAASSLSRLSVAMEHYHIEHGSYQGASLEGLGFFRVVGGYEVSIRVEGEGYELVAMPVERRDECGGLVLDGLGERGVTGRAGVEECW